MAQPTPAAAPNRLSNLDSSTGHAAQDRAGRQSIGTVVDFLQEVARLRVDEAVELLAPHFVCRGIDGQPIWDRGSYRGLLAWFAELGSVMACDGLERHEASAIASLRVRNEFYELAGIVVRRFRVTFRMEKGRIAEQVVEHLDPAAPTDVEACEPALRWARAHRPELVDRITDDDGLRYDRASAQPWLEVLRGWRDQRS